MSDPVCRIKIEFEGQNQPWEYPIALNGRTVASVSLDSVPYAPREALDSLIRSLLLTLVQATSGNIAPRELNAMIERYTDQMEAFGVI